MLAHRCFTEVPFKGSLMEKEVFSQKYFSHLSKRTVRGILLKTKAPFHRLLRSENGADVVHLPNEPEYLMGKTTTV